MDEKFRPIDLAGVASKNEKKEKKVLSKEEIEEGREAYYKRKNELILSAILKHIQSVSYRAFRVGSSVVAHNKNSEDGYQIESAHNFKPIQHRQHSWDKLCAENNASTAVILDGADYISGIVVASHHKEIGNEVEDKTHAQHALHSCQNCRNLFREMVAHGIMSNETIIRFVDDGSLIYEDKEDTEPFTVTDDEEGPMEIGHPRLKLKKEIGTEDVANLPYEETTMKDFLDLYSDDPPSQPGYTPAPYTLVNE